MTTKFTSDHEWLTINGDIATVGITHHAQDVLGDVVFVELPAVGKQFKQKEVAGLVESVKAASDIYMPVSGEIVEVNNAIVADPGLVNSSAEKEAWFFKVKVSQASELNDLLDANAYQALIK